ncbi:hypothetical protein ACJRO7_003978 [Eucalyptus globulus]|uniref:DEVIL-like protein n=1 Tax=Eucalyptus globulus TaxID=34317 RepID=A0ABD3IYD6_EUCGL
MRQEMEGEEERSFCERRVASACRKFGRRCSRQVREQKARFYILRRCLTILLCWQRHELNDS